MSLPKTTTSQSTERQIWGARGETLALEYLLAAGLKHRSSAKIRQQPCRLDEPQLRRWKHALREQSVANDLVRYRNRQTGVANAFGGVEVGVNRQHRHTAAMQFDEPRRQHDSAPGQARAAQRRQQGCVVVALVGRQVEEDVQHDDRRCQGGNAVNNFGQIRARQGLHPVEPTGCVGAAGRIVDCDDHHGRRRRRRRVAKQMLAVHLGVVNSHLRIEQVVGG